MRLSCVVNNFNYGRYLAEAVRSALKQSTSFDEVIVVDDGSDDESAQVLRSIKAESPRVTVVTKPNGGQLSAFTAGFLQCTGDVVFFLDADDVMYPQYVERMRGVFVSNPDVGYAYCGRRLFGRVEEVDRPFDGEIDLGCSAAALAVGRFWLGASTSCISMRRSVLERLLPAPEIERDWVINADLCLAYGSSLAGVRKYCVPEPLVGYRVHDCNRYYGQPEDAASKYERRLRSNSLTEYYLRRFNYDRRGLSRLLDAEFATIPRPNRTLLRQYLRIALESEAPILRRLWQAQRILRRYLATGRAAAEPTSRGARAPATTPATTPLPRAA